MKHKTAELEGALLDAAVAIAEGWHRCTALAFNVDEFDWREPPTEDDELGALVATGDRWQPSTDWADGGPIIERERIALMYVGDKGWAADFSIGWHDQELDTPHLGPTPLIAAMRAYVASKSGEEVELP